MPVFSGKLADVFGKIWACFFRTWKILSIIRTFFRSSAQHTFSANRKTYIFGSLA